MLTTNKYFLVSLVIVAVLAAFVKPPKFGNSINPKAAGCQIVTPEGKAIDLSQKETITVPAGSVMDGRCVSN